MPNPFRTSKVRGVIQGYDPASGSGSYGFDTLAPIPLFYVNLAIANGVLNTAIQDVYVVPQRMEIVKIFAAVNAGAAYQVTDAFNIVKGTGAESAASGSGWAVQATGNSVFATDKAFGAFAISTNFNVTAQFLPDTPTAWFDTGDLLTLRVVTGATVGTHFAVTSGFAIQVFALVQPVDALPGKNDAGTATSPNF